MGILATKENTKIGNVLVVVENIGTNLPLYLTGIVKKIYEIEEHTFVNMEWVGVPDNYKELSSKGMYIERFEHFEQQANVDDHQGMIQNPLTGDWVWF